MGRKAEGQDAERVQQCPQPRILSSAMQQRRRGRKRRKYPNTSTAFRSNRVKKKINKKQVNLYPEHKQAVIIPLLRRCSIIRHQAPSDLTLPQHCASLQRASAFSLRLPAPLFKSVSSQSRLAFWTVSVVLSFCLLHVAFYICWHLCISPHLSWLTPICPSFLRFPSV